MKSYLTESLHVDQHVIHSQYDGWWYSKDAITLTSFAKKSGTFTARAHKLEIGAVFGIIYLCVIGLMQDFGVLR